MLKKRPFRLSTVGPALLVAVLLLSGCQTYTEKSASLDYNFRVRGDLPGAVAEIDKAAPKKNNDRDGILYRLEQGAILRAAALDAATPEAARDLLARSNAAFDAAEKRINAYEEAARIKAGSETAAIFSNQAALPYRGRAYDKVMMNTYKALNFLQLGDHDRARVEINRAYRRQQDAVHENARRIAETQEAARKAAAGSLADEKGRASSYDVNRAMADPKAAGAIARATATANNAAAAQPYADYVNPFSVLMDAIFFSACGVDGADLERSRKSFERVTGMAPGNPSARKDLADVSEGRRPAGVTYVIFETGHAPWRGQERIDIPLYVVTDRINYIGAALPRLELHANTVPALFAAGAPAELVSSMDSIVARDFKNEWPSILVKTLLSTAIKATVSATLQHQALHNKDANARLIAGITGLAGAIIQFATNIADTRTWRSLPKEFHYVRVDTPRDRRLVVQSGGHERAFVLGEGEVHLVYVKSLAPGKPFLASSFKLR